MALPSFYNAGTATVAANGTAVTGQGTSWVGAVQPGDLFGTHKGAGVRIESVNSNTSLTLAYPWLGGAQTAAVYEIGITPDTARMQETTRVLLDLLGNYGFFQFNESGTLANRASFNAAAKGFLYLRTDVSPAQLYVKASATSGDWAGPFAYGKGDTGPAGPGATLAGGTTTTLAPGAPATSSLTGTAPNYTLNLGLPKGETGPAPNLAAGTVTTLQPGEQATASVGGSNPNYVINLGVPKGDRGLSGPNTKINTYRFAGDGTTVSFNLGISPEAKDYVVVAISGVLQATTSYTLTGSQITFDQPPPGDGIAENIEARVLSAVTNAPLGDVNLLINPSFDRWLEGTSFTGTGGHAADLWRYNRSGGAATVTQQPNPDPNGSPFILRSAVSGQSAASDFMFVAQRIESARTLAGKKCSISFDARVTTGTGEIAVEVAQSFGTGGSPSAAVTAIGTQKFNLSTGFTRFTLDGIIIPSVAGKTFGTDGNDWLGLTFWLSAGSNYDSRTAALGAKAQTVELRDIQVEEGEICTPFRRRAIVDDEWKALRYFWMPLFVKANADPVTVVIAAAATALRGVVRYPRVMRTNPAFSRSAAGDFQLVPPMGITYSDVTRFVSDASNEQVCLDVAATGATVGTSTILRATGTGTAWLKFDARL